MAVSSNCVQEDYDFGDMNSGELMRIVQSINDETASHLIMQMQESQHRHPAHMQDQGIRNFPGQDPQPHGHMYMPGTSSAYMQGMDRHLGASDRVPQAPAETPWVEIVEQPKSRGLRFRYECEGRSAGSVPGESSTNENKTYPAIKVHGYNGPAIVVVSCVTKESPPHCKPHPHAFVGRDCKKGVCTLKVKDTSERIVFQQIGIQCAKKKDVEGSLRLRKEINVDPFQTGFDHVQSNIDLNVVRMCFQVFLPNEQGKVTRVIPAVVSHPIHDKKSSKDLVICRVDRSSGKSRGGDEIFLLCDKVNKEDIKIRFFEENDQGLCVWENYGDFGQGDVHRQYAIVFQTPAYHNLEIPRPVEVHMQLKRPSDGETSDSIPFTFMPDDPDPDRIAEKRKRKAQRLVDFWKSAGNTEIVRGSGASVRGRLSTMLRGMRRIKKDPDATQGVPQYSLDNIGGSGDMSGGAEGGVSHVTADNSSMGSITISSISAGSIDSSVIADLSGLSSSDLSVVSTENGQLVISVPGGDGSGLSMDSINLPTNMLSGDLINQIDIQQLNAYLQDQGSGTESLLGQPASADNILCYSSRQPHFMDTDLDTEAALHGLSSQI